MTSTATRRPRAAALAVAALSLLVVAGPARAGGEWNDAGIAWRPFDKALAESKSSKKPVLLVVYAEWCPHCTNYSQVFHDPKVVEMAKKFVMVRIDKEEQPKVAAMYKPDGDYVPRTLFLSADGKVRPDIDALRTDYRYFYSERDPASILRGMEKALAPAARKDAPPAAKPTGATKS